MVWGLSLARISKMAVLALAALSLNTASSVPFFLVFAKVSLAPLSWFVCVRGKQRRWNLLITFFEARKGCLVRGRIFLGLEMSGAKFFWRPYLNKICVFMKASAAERLFLPCFVEGFSRARNVFAKRIFTVSGAEKRVKLKLRRAVCAQL